AAGAVLKPQGGNCAVLPYVFYGGISICSILPLLPSTPKSALNFFSIRNHGVWHCFVPLQPAYT
ncbi:hypothetical protein, partial [Gemmiger sp.]|uniref:hypothetical protein n=1 Tax=Gemmiger sp. TaxID=2049027 RepID=UPI0025C1B0DB